MANDGEDFSYRHMSGVGLLDSDTESDSACAWIFGEQELVFVSCQLRHVLLFLPKILHIGS